MFPKRGAAALAVTVVALVLLLSFKTPDQLVANVGGSIAIIEDAPVAQAPEVTQAPDAATQAPAATADAPAPTTAPAEAMTVTGPTVDTRFGPVQVEITVSGGQITAVTATQLPSGGRSGRISRAAAPILRDEALQAQSANIDTVSGATYTSEAYAQSLQAALDEAGI